MAAPNIVNVATITGKTATLALSTTSMTSLVSNAASSGKVFKINSLYVANVDGLLTADITVNLFSEDDIGGTGYSIAKTIPVPPDATLQIIEKGGAIYLEEDKSLGVQASAVDSFAIVCSYEEIS